MACCPTHVPVNTREIYNQINGSDWMANLPTKVTKLPLKQLVIPGSHDSGAYYLDPSTPIAPGEPSIVYTLSYYFGSCVKSVIKRWSTTQQLNFTNQLEIGIRYFDMRSAYLKSVDDILCVHGLYGYPIKKLLIEINNFLNSHPKEVVILDFNHFYSLTPQLHQRLVQNILKVFADKIYSPSTKGINSSLDDIWSVKKQVIIVYSNEQMVKQVKLLWPSKFIDSPWFNTSSISTLINDLDNRFHTLKDQSFNIFQAILTPQTTTVITKPAGSLKSSLALKGNEVISTWIDKVFNQKQHGVNIVILDFCETSDNVAKLLELNDLL